MASGKLTRGKHQISVPPPHPLALIAMPPHQDSKMGYSPYVVRIIKSFWGLRRLVRRSQLSNVRAYPPSDDRPHKQTPHAAEQKRYRAAKNKKKEKPTHTTHPTRFSASTFTFAFQQRCVWCVCLRCCTLRLGGSGLPCTLLASPVDAVDVLLFRFIGV